MKKLAVIIAVGILVFTFFLRCSSGPSGQQEFSVLQINIWQEGTMVPKGYDAIIDEIIDKDPDIVTFSEIRNYQDTDFIARVLASLKEKGAKYYGESSRPGIDVGVVSKFPVVAQEPLYEKEKQVASVLKTTLQVDELEVLLYSAHLDYTHYACYLPRGYNGATWEKMDSIITDPEVILTANRESTRAESMEDILRDVELQNPEAFIMVAGDFNEPSHLDWAEDTRDLYDHNGAVVPWDCSMMLAQSGFRDAYRVIYPSAVTHPGFTFPSYNPDVDIKELAWAPASDERDRIDFIYYLPHPMVKLEQIHVVGPEETVSFGKEQKGDSEDEFLLPKGVWPSDHKGMLAQFKVL